VGRCSSLKKALARFPSLCTAVMMGCSCTSSPPCSCDGILSHPLFYIISRVINDPPRFQLLQQSTSPVILVPICLGVATCDRSIDRSSIRNASKPQPHWASKLADGETIRRNNGTETAHLTYIKFKMVLTPILLQVFQTINPIRHLHQTPVSQSA